MYIRTTLWTLEYFYSIKVVKTRHLTQTGYIAVHRRNGTSCTFTWILNPLKASVMNQNIIKLSNSFLYKHCNRDIRSTVKQAATYTKQT